MSTTPQADEEHEYIGYAKYLINDQAKGLLHMSDTQISEIMGVSRPTAALAKKDPSKLSLNNIILLERHVEFVKAALLTTMMTAVVDLTQSSKGDTQ